MQFTALEFETDQILVAAARQVGRQAEIQHAFTIPMGDRDDAKVAEAIKSALAKHGLSRSETIVVVNRSSVEIREVSVPPAPDNELPDMVRMLARNEFASLNDNWLLDFVPLSNDPQAPRKVLATGLSPERHRQIIKIADAAGINVKHIVLRPFASFDFLRPTLKAGKSNLIVDLAENQTDMIISHDLNVVATRTVRVPASEDTEQRIKSLVSEIKRTLASARGSLGDRNVNEIVVLGDTPADELLAERLREQLSVEVGFIQPFQLIQSAPKFKLPEHPAQYSALLGSLTQQISGNRHSIDYLNPRRPIVQKSDRQKLYLYGGSAVAAALMGLIFGWWTLSSQATEIAQLDTKLLQAIEKNKGDSKRPGVEQVIGEVGKIDEWKQSDINWLDELYEYSERFLTPDDAIVDSFDAGSRRDQPQIIVRARMSSGEIESAVVNSLDSRPYEVLANKWLGSDDDPSYTTSGDLNVLLSVDPSAVIKQIDVKAAAFLKQQMEARQNAATPQ